MTNVIGGATHSQHPIINIEPLVVQGLYGANITHTLLIQVNS